MIKSSVLRDTENRDTSTIGKLRKLGGMLVSRIEFEGLLNSVRFVGG